MRIINKGKKKILHYLAEFHLGWLRSLKSSSQKGLEEGRIIVSMTSWSKRIVNVPAVISSILRNSVLPDLIVVNLSEVEFPNRLNDLPQQLVEMVSQGKVEINWMQDNTKAFKKIIPTMKKYPNDFILGVDDDFYYPNDFIETFVKKHKESPNVPLSGNTVRINNAQAHCGCASLISARYYGRFIDELLDDEVIRLGADDVFYTFCAALSGYYYMYVGREFFHNMSSIDDSFALSDNGGYNNDRMIEYLCKKIKRKYSINLNDLSFPLYKFSFKNR